MKKTKRTGLLGKVVVLILLVAASIALLNMSSRLNSAVAARDALQTQVNEQTQHNAALQSDIENASDPEVIVEVAKQRLGLVSEDEVIIYDSSN